MSRLDKPTDQLSPNPVRRKNTSSSLVSQLIAPQKEVKFPELSPRPKMKPLVSKLKSFLRRDDNQPALPTRTSGVPVANTASDVHNTPAGRYPSSGPQPSKIPVLLYYTSCVFIIIGVIMLVRYGFMDWVGYRKKMLA
jgi:hypothetical protein